MRSLLIVVIVASVVACTGGAVSGGAGGGGATRSAGGSGGGGGGKMTNTGGGAAQTGGGTGGATGTDLCAAIANFALTSSSGTTVSLSWVGAADVSVSVLRKTYCGTDDYAVLATLPAGATSFVDTTAQQNWAYWYELTATDAAGNHQSAAVPVWASQSTPPAGCPGDGAPQGSEVVPDACGHATEDAGTVLDAGVTTIDAGSSQTPPTCDSSATNAKTAGAKADGVIDDTAALQAAINGGAHSVSLPAGTYLLTSPLDLPAGTTLCSTDGAVLKASGNGGFNLLQSPENNITIIGLTFEGGGIEATASHSQGGWTITNNTFQNITTIDLYGAAIYIDAILTTGDNGRANTISHNTFTNIWQSGYPNAPPGNDGSAPDNNPLHCRNQDCIGGSGIWWHGGLDNTIIDHNTFDKIGYNAIKGFYDYLYSKTPGWAFTAHNVVLSNNIMTNVHRIGIEVQGIGYGGCMGGCDYSLIPSDGTIVSGNYWHAPAFTWDPFAYSILFGGTHAMYINNTGVNEDASCALGPGIGIEDGMLGGITQGNVIGSVRDACQSVGGDYGWADYVTDSFSQPGYTNTYQDNIFCGPGQPSAVDANPSPDVANLVDQYNFKTSDCPNANLAQSSVTVAFTSSDHQAVTVSATWKVAVVSTLSIRDVQFFVDGSSTPAVTQQVQDVSTTFATDRQWLYHATVDTTGLTPGAHPLRAVATDVSGAAVTASQTFTR